MNLFGLNFSQMILHVYRNKYTDVQLILLQANTLTQYL